MIKTAGVVTICKPGHLHRKRLGVLYVQYLKEFEVKASPALIDRLLSRLYQQSFVHLLIAEVSSELCGFVSTTDSFSPVSACLALEINDLFVVPSMRGRGIGTLLVKSVSQLARRLGRKKLFAQAVPQALYFYQRLGWTQTSYISISKTL